MPSPLDYKNNEDIVIGPPDMGPGAHAGTSHPALLLDANPEESIHDDPLLDAVTSPENVELTDMRLARAHAATNIEFLTFTLWNNNTSARLLAQDDSRKRITILPNGNANFYISREPLDFYIGNGIDPAKGILSPVPAILCYSFASAFTIDGSQELYATTNGTTALTQPILVPIIIERYSSGQ